jgi:adenylate cyclase
MATEIERKFLIRGDDWRQQSPTRICQGYLSRDKDRTVRVRIAGSRAYLTIKGSSKGATRTEFEYEIPLADAQQLLSMCDGPVLDKNRHVLKHAGTTWEVDEFLGANAGLVVAEVELEREDQPFERPAWLGKEVTEDARYYNSNLAAKPYSTWRSGDES